MHCLDTGARLAVPRSQERLDEMLETALEADAPYCWLGLYQSQGAKGVSLGWSFVDGGSFTEKLKSNLTAAIDLWTLAEPDDGDDYFYEGH